MKRKNETNELPGIPSVQTNSKFTIAEYDAIYRGLDTLISVLRRKSKAEENKIITEQYQIQISDCISAQNKIERSQA